DRLEHHEMQMRLARETGLPGEADRLADFHLVADLYESAVRLEMMVIGECAVAVFDDHVISERLKFWVGAADGGIIAHADDTALAGGAHGRAFGHVPIDRILTAGTNEMAVAAARPLHDDVAARAEGHRVIIIVVGRVSPAAIFPVVIIVVAPGPRRVGSLEFREDK